MIVAALEESISLNDANRATVRLRIAEPESFNILMSIEVKPQVVQTAWDPVLALQFHGIDATYGGVVPFNFY
jgi:hypothetical protein